MRQRRRGRGGLKGIFTPLNLLACAAAWAGLQGGLGGPALAATLSGRVVGVTDGDTLVVLDTQRATHRVRLAGIDAPEKHQAHADRAHQQLALMAHGRAVAVHFDHKDRYGRLLGQVWVNGKDINLALLEGGWAWHYIAYASEQSPTDRKRYAEAEQDARAARRGLWSAPHPTAPWVFRGTQRRPGQTSTPP